METTTKLFMDMKEQLRAAQKCEQDLKAEVQEMKAHPVVLGAMKYHSRMTQSGQIFGQQSSSTPSMHQQSPAPGTQSASPANILFERPPLFSDESSEDDISDGDESKGGEREDQCPADEQEEGGGDGNQTGGGGKDGILDQFLT